MDEVEFTGDGVKLIKNIEDGIKWLMMAAVNKKNLRTWKK
jgi:TPR repeat protein